MVSSCRAARVALSLVLAGSLAFASPAAAWADAEGEPSEPPAAPAEAAENDAASSDELFDYVYHGRIETSAEGDDGIALFSLDSSGRVALKPGNYVEWIDRIDVPSYARQFYEVLAEASDGDGTRDFLIDDAYYDGAASAEGAYRSIGGLGTILVGSATLPSNSAQTQALVAEMGEYAMATLAAFDRDHPEVFWLSGSVSVVFQVKGKTLSCYMLLSESGKGVRSSDYTSAHQIRTDIWNRDQRVRAILKGLKTGATQEDAVRYFDWWLREHNEYNTLVAAGSTPKTHSPWECLSALTGTTGQNGPVCEGYARAFKVLCSYAGIPCVLVDGNAGGPHMWNNVKLGNAWYAADVTWNDTGVPANLQTFLLVGAGTVFGGQRFDQSHVVENRVFDDRNPGGVAFTNGPVLSEAAFAPSTATPAVSVQLPPATAAPKRKLASMALSKTSYTFTGKVRKPAVTVLGEGGVRLVQNRDYTVKITGNQKSVGSYRVTVTGINSYAGSLAKSYKIVAPSVKKVAKPTLKSSKKKTLTTTWKRVTGNVTGYQVQACTSKKFKKSVSKKTVKLTTKTKKSKTLKVTLTKLKSKKTYYVRVRAYYKIGGKTFYGTWSTVKKVRVK